MYFPELARGREGEREIRKEHEMEDRQKAEANQIMTFTVRKIKKTNFTDVQSRFRGKRREIVKFL